MRRCSARLSRVLRTGTTRRIRKAKLVRRGLASMPGRVHVGCSVLPRLHQLEAADLVENGSVCPEDGQAPEIGAWMDPIRPL